MQIRWPAAIPRRPTNPPESPLDVLERTLRRLPEGAVFSGRTAGWIYGLDLPACSPIDVTVDEGSRVSGRAGIAFHKAKLQRSETGFKRGLPVTSEVRTVLDLARRLPRVEAIAAVDMALHAELVELEELHQFVRKNPGTWGISRVRAVAELADPAAESPMETRLRLILIGGGLPRPETQISINDGQGDFVARPDFLYRRERIAIEFDGGVHRLQLVEDNRRQNRLLDAGYRILRFTTPDLASPARIVAEVKAALDDKISRENRAAE